MYGFRGALLIIGAINLNSIPGCFLWTSTRTERRKGRIQRDKECRFERYQLEFKVNVAEAGDTITINKESVLPKTRDIFYVRKFPVLHNQLQSKRVSVTDGQTQDLAHLEQNVETQPLLKRLISVLRIGYFSAFWFGSILTIASLSLTLIFVTDIFLDIGLSKDDANVGLLLLNILNTLDRILPGALMQTRRVPILFCPLVGTIMATGVMTAFILTTSKWVKLVFCAFIGVPLGMFHAMLSVVSVSLVGTNNLTIAMGLIFTTSGITNAIAGPITGHTQYTKVGRQSGRATNRRRVVIPQTPDVLQHVSRPRGRSRSRQDSFSDGTTKTQSVTKTGSAMSSRKWYTDGFPALRVAEKKIRDIRARQETGKLADSVNKKKRSRSYSRGRSVYSHDSDQPYYRSKSLDRVNLRKASFVPVTNEDDVINMTYTGRSSRENSMDMSSSRSSRRGSLSRRGSGIVLKRVESVVPHMRDSYEFDDLQTRIYQQIQKLYGQPDNNVKQKQFFTTFGQVQSDHKRINSMNINEDDKKFLEKMFQAFQQMKVETGKILKNSSQRYGSRDKQYSPLNEKLRHLTPSHRDEDFLTKLPKTKDKLKISSLRQSRRNNKNHLKSKWNFTNYNNYDFDAGNKIANFQKVKERLLKSSKTRSANDSNHRHLLGQPSRAQRPSSLVNLNRGRKSSSRIARVYENHKDGAPFGRLSPLKRNTKQLSTLEVKKPESTGYVRPEVFYNPRAHVYHNDRTRLLGHRLNESRQNDVISKKRTDVFGFAI